MDKEWIERYHKQLAERKAIRALNAALGGQPIVYHLQHPSGFFYIGMHRMNGGCLPEAFVSPDYPYSGSGVLMMVAKNLLSEAWERRVLSVSVHPDDLEVIGTRDYEVTTISVGRVENRKIEPHKNNPLCLNNLHLKAQILRGLCEQHLKEANG